jgi:hypothetical protein
MSDPEQVYDRLHTALDFLEKFCEVHLAEQSTIDPYQLAIETRKFLQQTFGRLTNDDEKSHARMVRQCEPVTSRTAATDGIDRRD